MPFFDLIAEMIVKLFGSKANPLPEDRILNSQEDSVWNGNQWLREVLRLAGIVALCFLAWFFLT